MLLQGSVLKFVIEQNFGMLGISSASIAQTEALYFVWIIGLVADCVLI